MPLSKSSKTSNESSYDYKVYHVTKKENAESILKEKKFRIPTQEDAVEKGLKLGAAVYFGLDPNYCFKEAMNSLLESEPQLLKVISSDEDRIKIQNVRLVCLEVDVELINGPTSIHSFGNYRDGQLGELYWPLIDHHSMTSVTTPQRPLLPNGDEIEDTITLLSSEKWDETTELLTFDYLSTYYGLDALTINEDTDHEFEIAIYELDCIVNIKRWNNTTDKYDKNDMNVNNELKGIGKKE